MKEYTIFADYHIGHPFGIEPAFSFNENTVFLGDNFDVKNALKNKLSEIVRLREKTINNCENSGGIYISGNHSLEPITNKSKLIAIRNGILFTHGDIIGFGSKSANLYRTLFSPGKNKFFWVILKGWRKLFPGTSSRFTKKQIKRMIELVKQNNCKTLVMGHFHTKNGVIDFVKNGIRIVVVPRGKTVIKL